MSSSLFREEALEHRKDRLFGEMILLQPLSMRILVGVASFVCILIVLILFCGTYARKETVKGFLVTDKGVVKTYAPQQGTIVSIDVREGDVVKRGQTLLTLLSERSLQGGSDIESLHLKEIQNTEAHLLEQIRGQDALSLSEGQRLHNQIEGFKKELKQIDSGIQAQESRLDILTKRLNAAAKLLEQKYLSEQDYQKLNEGLIEQKQLYQKLIREKVATQNNLDQAQSQLDQLPIRNVASMNELQNKISELKQRKAEVEGKRGLEVRSPIEGTVTAIQTKPGQTAVPNSPLLAIIPLDCKFQVELLVPTRAIGFIQPGQTVRIRLDPFPYQRFGVYEGVVTVIAKHVLLPNESLLTANQKEPVYQITVELKQQYVSAYGKQFPLQAGMSLEADIILDRQTLFARIFEPILSIKGKL